VLQLFRVGGEMADDKRMIAIAIAVANSVPRKYLSGAINGAHAFEKWAKSQGYETALVTDEAENVTLPLLRQKLEAILKAWDNPKVADKPIHRIIVYFAGHGLIRDLEEGLWLMSDWQEELRAVAVEVLKRRLTMYAPHQICIISDACRSLPADVEQADLVADSVLGAGPKPVDMTIAIDKFIAAQDGTEAFTIPGEDPQDDRCLFSGVLIEGLWGQAGLKNNPFSKLEPDKVTSRSLGDYLKDEVLERAKTYGLELKPTIVPTFPDLDNYYFSKSPPVKPPPFAPWPPKSTFDAMNAGGGSRAPAGLEPAWPLELEVPPAPRGPGASSRPDAPRNLPGFGLRPAGHPGPSSPPQTSSALDQLRGQKLPSPSGGNSSGIGVAGRYNPRLWLQQNIRSKRSGGGSFWVAVADNTQLGTPAPALVEFSDGRFAAPVVLPGFFVSLARDKYGVTGMLYRNLMAPREVSAPVEQALADLENGTLRADEATDLAVKLRVWKHADPVLGVISAYLYDSIGDVDSIRRMASFYVQNNQAIPYDIALLGGLTGRRADNGFWVEIPEVKQRKPRTEAEKKESWTYCAMPARKGLVGGLWPWMRQGWVFLDDPTDVGSPIILNGLIDLRSGLMRSRFTTLERDAALELARICGLHGPEEENPKSFAAM